MPECWQQVQKVFLILDLWHLMQVEQRCGGELGCCFEYQWCGHGGLVLQIELPVTVYYGEDAEVIVCGINAGGCSVGGWPGYALFLGRCSGMSEASSCAGWNTP